MYKQAIVNLLKFFLHLKELCLSFKTILESSDYNISTIYEFF